MCVPSFNTFSRSRLSVNEFSVNTFNHICSGTFLHQTPLCFLHPLLNAPLSPCHGLEKQAQKEDRIAKARLLKAN